MKKIIIGTLYTLGLVILLMIGFGCGDNGVTVTNNTKLSVQADSLLFSLDNLSISMNDNPTYTIDYQFVSHTISHVRFVFDFNHNSDSLYMNNHINGYVEDTTLHDNYFEFYGSGHCDTTLDMPVVNAVGAYFICNYPNDVMSIKTLRIYAVQ